MATRLYFPATEASPVNPAIDAGWDDIGGLLRRKLADTKGSSAITIGSTISITEDTLNDAIDRQYVSTRMNAGIVFTATTHTVSMQLMVREYATTDNVDMAITCIKIVSEDGNTVRATIKAIGGGFLTLEFINNVSHRNHTVANAYTLDASYTTVLGDRICVEIGYRSSTGANTTPQASAKWGENVTDLPVNNTQTTDGAGWIEFSNTITFAGEVSNPFTKNIYINQSVNRASNY